MNLTQKELQLLDEQLLKEQILIKKYRCYAKDCSDPELKALCNRAADKHQQYMNTLIGFLQ